MSKNSKPKEFDVLSVRRGKQTPAWIFRCASCAAEYVAVLLDEEEAQREARARGWTRTWGDHGSWVCPRHAIFYK